MTWQGERFEGRIGLTVEESSPAWPEHPRPSEGTPNVVLVVLDDVGFGHLGCFGGACETPAIDALAQRGLRYSAFHTTALCSPTRACLLTGRNHHAAGLGMISELSQGYPGYDGVIRPSRGFLTEVLHEQGFVSFHVGKYHLVPTEETTMAGPWDRWPLGRGFDRFYGFLGAETNQWYPELVHDNHPVEAPRTPEDGYHLTDDLTDKAIEFVRDLRSVDPSKPFFLYYCPGATHAPHQVPAEWIERYRGRFDTGWNALRDEILERQLALGLLPEGTALSPWPDWVARWDELDESARRLFARQMEVFAAFLSHTDHHIGRLVAALEELGELDDTLIIVCSDNGASGEGGANGTFNENIFFNAGTDTVEQNLEHFDALGGIDSYGHYATGWTVAGNTPFRRWKRNVHAGGTTDPLIVSWPQGIAARGEVRSHYLHAIDVMPTILDVLGVEMPAMLRGVPQEALHGRSFAATFDDPSAPEVRRSQYYEMYGSRAYYADGWKAVTFHAIPGIPGDGPGDATLPYTQDRWELYDLTRDRTETTDLAATEPDRLQSMIASWYADAGRYDVLPLHTDQRKGLRPSALPERTAHTYWPGAAPVNSEAAVDTRMRPFTVVAPLVIPDDGAEGVIVAQGGQFGGWALFVHDGRLVYEHNYLALERYRVVSDRVLEPGRQTLGLAFSVSGAFEISAELSAMGTSGVSGTVTLYCDDAPIGSGPVERTVPFQYTLSGDGLCCGYDGETPVSDLYRAPFRFTGTIDRVVVSVDGAPYRNAAKEVELALRRD